VPVDQRLLAAIDAAGSSASCEACQKNR
jgi:hypothetical protein